MSQFFDPSIGLWRDSETGLTGATAEDLRLNVINFQGGLVTAKARSFSPLVRAFASFGVRAKGSSDFRPTPQLDARFGGASQQ